jgi:hypothetical protein
MNKSVHSEILEGEIPVVFLDASLSSYAPQEKPQPPILEHVQQTRVFSSSVSPNHCHLMTKNPIRKLIFPLALDDVQQTKVLSWSIQLVPK